MNFRNIPLVQIETMMTYGILFVEFLKIPDGDFNLTEPIATTYLVSTLLCQLLNSLKVS